jgi:hypothetical protein
VSPLYRVSCQWKRRANLVHEEAGTTAAAAAREAAPPQQQQQHQEQGRGAAAARPFLLFFVRKITAAASCRGKKAWHCCPPQIRSSCGGGGVNPAAGRGSGTQEEEGRYDQNAKNWLLYSVPCAQGVDDLLFLATRPKAAAEEEHPYLKKTRNFAPVLHETHVTHLPVQGTLPPTLTGSDS